MFWLFESVIYKLPVTSHWKTYSKASPNRDIVRFTRVVQSIEVHSALDLRFDDCQEHDMFLFYHFYLKVCS